MVDPETEWVPIKDKMEEERYGKEGYSKRTKCWKT
jgi:hypothetical protein